MKLRINRDWGLKGRGYLDSELVWLHRLARRHAHIITQYRNTDGLYTRATPDQILAVLQTMKIPIQSPRHAQAMVESLMAIKAQAGPPPVAVAGHHQSANVLWSLPKTCTRVEYVITDEAGASTDGTFVPDQLPAAPRTFDDPGKTRSFYWQSPRLTLGYHTVTWNFLGRIQKTLIIVPPDGAPTANLREWGLFFPLYGLSSHDNWGAGNLTDLERVATWAHELGGRFIGTLPLLATFLDEPYDPSPYRPVSQRYWNEFYLDVDQVLKETDHNGYIFPEGLDRELERLRQSPRVDYRAGMALRRQALEKMASNHQSRVFDQWRTAHPDVRDYAEFRALVEIRGTSWRTWADDAPLPNDKEMMERRHYHEFVQWQMDSALKAFTDRERSRGGGLYLDLPIGVHPDGYDAWHEQDLFVSSASVGAPPDAFFPSGQNWGFEPLHPERIREEGYQYFIESLRHHMCYAKILRLDHVMGFYRRFWIPESLPVSDGLYVRYPAHEFYAIIDLEAHRSGTIVVGENLGLVPRAVDVAMTRHHYLGTWIFPSPEPPSESTLSLVGTHDMPPWATYWENAPPRQREALCRQIGVTDTEAEADQVLAQLLTRMAESLSQLTMVNLEDLYGETLPINVPGLQSDTNWSRKMRKNWEAIQADPKIQKMLETVNYHRTMPEGGDR